MPVGGFLDSFPTMVFVAAHALFLLVGVWAMRRATLARLPYSGAFWLYIISQVGFLAVFRGLLTLKMGVLLEQLLMLVFIVLVVRPAPAKA